MNIYNDDELNAPNWMNKDFFAMALGEYENNTNVEVTKLEITPASMKGDHFASIMFRAKVEYKRSGSTPAIQISLIVKTIPEEESMKRDLLQESKLFETEIDMFAKALPAIEAILAEHGDVSKLAPKIIWHALQPRKIIIMEDLCVSGFGTVRSRYLTDTELTAVFRKLAKLHAVSVKLGRSEKHEVVTTFDEGIFSTDMVLNNEMIAGGISKFIDMLSVHDQFDEYLPKFKAIEKDLFAGCKRLFHAYQSGVQDDQLFVLNHGDFHMRNLMFKFNAENEMEDVIMVDFQLCVFAPPVIDIIYSTFMIMSPEQRARRDDFVRIYFDNFIDTLKMIGYKDELPKFSDFQMAFVRYRHFAVFMLSTFLPTIISMMTLRPEDMTKMDFSKMMEKPDMFTWLFRKPELVAEVGRLLPVFLREGYLD